MRVTHSHVSPPPPALQPQPSAYLVDIDIIHMVKWTRPQARSFIMGPLPSSVYLSRHWHHSHDKIEPGKMDQASPLHFCILQAFKNWVVGRPGNEAKSCPLTGIKYMTEYISEFTEVLKNTSSVCMLTCIGLEVWHEALARDVRMCRRSPLPTSSMFRWSACWWKHIGFT